MGSQPKIDDRAPSRRDNACLRGRTGSDWRIFADGLADAGTVCAGPSVSASRLLPFALTWIGRHAQNGDAPAALQIKASLVGHLPLPPASGNQARSAGPDAVSRAGSGIRHQVLQLPESGPDRIGGSGYDHPSDGQAHALYPITDEQDGDRRGPQIIGKGSESRRIFPIMCADKYRVLPISWYRRRTALVKVQFKNLGSRKGTKVSKKSVRTTSGTTVTVRRLDADSDTFSDDFRYVFEKNVEKARRENKKLARAAGEKN